MAILKIHTPMIVKNLPKYQTKSKYRSINPLIPLNQMAILLFTCTIAGHTYQYYYAEGETNGFCVDIHIDRHPIKWVKDEDYLSFLKQLAKHINPLMILHDLFNIMNHTKYGELDIDYVNNVISPMMNHYTNTKLTEIELAHLKALYYYLYLAFIAEYYYVGPSGKLSRLGPAIKLLSIKQTVLKEKTPIEAANWSRHRCYREIKAAIITMYNQLSWPLDNAYFIKYLNNTKGTTR